MTPVWIVLVAQAVAAEPNLAPDRPGIGDSTETPGAGHVLIEGGLVANFADSGTTYGTSGVTLRVGLGDVVEARLNVPDLVLPAGEIGPIGLGMKIGGELTDTWSMSLVPTLLVAADAAWYGGQLNANVQLDLDRVAMWGHVSTTAIDGRGIVALGTGTLVGAGVQVPIATGGAFVHVGREVSDFGRTMVGAGGFWCPSDTVQLDVEFDVWGVGQDVVAVPNLGVAAVF